MSTTKLKQRLRAAEALAEDAIAEAVQLRDSLWKMRILTTRLVGENRQMYLEAKLLRDIIRVDEARWLKRLWRWLTFSKAIVPADGSPIPVTQAELNSAAAAAKTTTKKDQSDDPKGNQKSQEKNQQKEIKLKPRRHA